MKNSIVYIKGTWIHILIRGEDVWDKLDIVYKGYKDKNNKEPEGYVIESDNSNTQYSILNRQNGRYNRSKGYNNENKQIKRIN